MAGRHRPGKRLRGEDITDEVFGNNSGTGSYLRLVLKSEKSLKSRGWPWVQTCLRGILGKEKLDKANFLRDGSLMVKTKNPSQTEKLMGLKQMMGEACEVFRDQKLNTSRGTIRAYDLEDLSDDEIVQWLGEFGVVQAKRFTRRVAGNTVPTPTVLLTFDMPTCPEKIQLDYITYHVKKHIPSPLMCFKCGQYGHPEKRCNNERRCLKCGELEHAGMCEVKCMSCGDTGHTCRSHECKTWKKENEICKLKVELEVSYAEARKHYENTYKPPQLQSYSEMVRMPSDHRAGEDGLKKKVEQLEKKIDEMSVLLTRMAEGLTLPSVAALTEPEGGELAAERPVSGAGDVSLIDQRMGERGEQGGSEQGSGSDAGRRTTETESGRGEDGKRAKGKDHDMMTTDILSDYDTVNSDIPSQPIIRRSRSIDRGGSKNIVHRKSWKDKT